MGALTDRQKRENIRILFVLLMDPKKKPILFCFRYYNEVELPRRAAEEHNKPPEFNGPAQTVLTGQDPLPHCSIQTDERVPILKW